MRRQINKLIDVLKYPGKSRMLRSVKTMGTGCVFAGAVKIIGGDCIEIGDDFYAGPDCRIEAWKQYKDKTFSPEIRIGNNVRINSRCHIGAIRRIVISDNVLFGSGVFITDHSHGRVTPEENSIPPTDRDLYSKGEVVIGENVWIGENVTILPSVHIGNGAVIGAGSVVTKDIPDYHVAAGNPAKVVKDIR